MLPYHRVSCDNTADRLLCNLCSVRLMMVVRVVCIKASQT